MRSIFVLLVIVLIPIDAHSAGPNCPEPEKSKARELFRQGKTDYELRRLAEAEKSFAEAYRLCPMPDLLFNLGQVNRELGRAREARHYYVQFLETAPGNNPNRVTAEEFALKMNALAKQQEQRADDPPKGMVDPEAPQRSAAIARENRESAQKLKIGAIGTGVAAAALLAAGIGLSVGALQIGNEITNPSAGTRYDPDLASRGRAFDAAGISLIVIGSATAIVSIGLGIAASTRRRVDRASLSLRIASLEMTH